MSTTTTPTSTPAQPTLPPKDEVEFSCDKLNKVVITGKSVADRGTWYSRNDEIQIETISVTVGDQEYDVKVTTNFKANTVKLSAEKEALAEFHVKTSFKAGVYRKADDQGNVSSYALDNGKYQVSCPDFQPYRKLHDMFLRDFEDIASNDYALYDHGDNSLTTKAKADSLDKKPSDRYNGYAIKQLIFCLKHQEKVSLTVDEIHHFIKKGVTVKQIQDNKVKLEKLLTLTDPEKFNPKDYDFMLNDVGYEEKDGKFVLHASGGSQDGMRTMIQGKNGKVDRQLYMEKAQEAVRAALMAENIRQALQFAARSREEQEVAGKEPVEKISIHPEHGVGYGNPFVAKGTEGQPGYKAGLQAPVTVNNGMTFSESPRSVERARYTGQTKKLDELYKEKQKKRSPANTGQTNPSLDLNTPDGTPPTGPKPTSTLPPAPAQPANQQPQSQT
ncbi:hypothetical protein JQC92_16210 [Shewanella sp. 202IG2-18]|uniref:hypothetical protein n=1 Tax=Parashewanella hymeniacidonis TaxID=2807618 RepID=UPI00196214F8|nr:hypothetical protein [Parashewanella hymeniacidonis]MBM7073559.1 hypothetical protein [Parashewanella hymeniacidonis]